MPEQKRQRKGQRKIFEKIVAENFPNINGKQSADLRSAINPKDINTKRYIPRFLP